MSTPDAQKAYIVSSGLTCQKGEFMTGDHTCARLALEGPAPAGATITVWECGSIVGIAGLISLLCCVFCFIAVRRLSVARQAFEAAKLTHDQARDWYEQFRATGKQRSP